MWPSLGGNESIAQDSASSPMHVTVHKMEFIHCSYLTINVMNVNLRRKTGGKWFLQNSFSPLQWTVENKNCNCENKLNVVH